MYIILFLFKFLLWFLLLIILLPLYLLQLLLLLEFSTIGRVKTKKMNSLSKNCSFKEETNKIFFLSSNTYILVAFFLTRRFLPPLKKTSPFIGTQHGAVMFHLVSNDSCSLRRLYACARRFLDMRSHNEVHMCIFLRVYLSSYPSLSGGGREKEGNA